MSRIPSDLSRNGLGSVLDARVHGKRGAGIVVVRRTLRRRGWARRAGFRNGMTLHRVRVVRFRMRRVRLDVMSRFAEDDVVPVGDVIPPEVGLSHLLRSDGHWRPLPWPPLLRPTVLNRDVESLKMFLNLSIF